jgi:hypothetical protein
MKTGVVSSPPALNKYMSAILINIPVWNPNSARMWRAVPMPPFPHPTTAIPSPGTSNPNKTNGGRGGNYFHYRRWRACINLNFRSYRRYRRSRIGIDDASDCEERSGTNQRRHFE